MDATADSQSSSGESPSGASPLQQQQQQRLVAQSRRRRHGRRSGGGGGPPQPLRARVTRPAPPFKAQALKPDGSFGEIALEDFRGKYVLLYFWPFDFTFVCPSEIIAFDRAVPELERRNVQLLGCSVDSVYTHWAWTQKPREQGGIGKVSHPLLSDLSKSIAKQYNVLLDDGSVALRGIFLIDKAGVLRHECVNDLNLGRSVDEALRMVDALQSFELNGEVCPANWKKGGRTFKPTAEGVAQYLAEGEKA